MSSRHTALTAEVSPLYPARYGNVGAGFSEPSVGTALKEPLAVVWRNPRLSESVPTGSVQLNLVRQRRSEFPGPISTSANSLGLDRFASCVLAVIYPSVGYWEMGNSESTLSGLAFPAVDFWGECQFGSNLTGPIFPGSVPFQASCIEVPTVHSSGRAGEGKFRMAFQRAFGERFEDGMESQFSIELESLMESFGPDSIEILGRLLADGTGSPTVWAEALRWIGRAENFLPRSSRISLLERALSSDSAVVRDSAALGFATIDDPEAIPFLERAVASETLTALKADMQQVLEQLRGH